MDYDPSARRSIGGDSVDYNRLFVVSGPFHSLTDAVFWLVFRAVFLRITLKIHREKIHNRIEVKLRSY